MPSASQIAHRLDTGGGEPAARRVLGRAVAQHGPPEMRERCYPHPEAVHRLEQGHVSADRLASLQRQHERDESVGECGVDVGSGQAHANGVGVCCSDPPPGLEHPQRLAQRSLRAEVIVDEDRKHLDVHATCEQLRQPRTPEVCPLFRGAPARAEHQQIVVRVDNDRSLVQRCGGGGDVRHDSVRRLLVHSRRAAHHRSLVLHRPTRPGDQ